jgi:hypothetical protein
MDDPVTFLMLALTSSIAILLGIHLAIILTGRR